MPSHGTHCMRRRQLTHRKPNRRLRYAIAIIIMTGHKEMTDHYEASLIAIKQRHRYPDKNSSRPRQRQVTSKAYQVRYQRSEIISDLFPKKEKTSHSHREGASSEFQVLLHL